MGRVTDMPAQIGPYQVMREIGRGGMGVVYLAQDTKLDREVAIKCLPDEFAGDEQRLERFNREARLLASLNHPNIATVHGLEEVDGRKYFVLEYIDGESLADYLRQHGRSWRKCLEVASGIADALAAAHARGVAHRDVKPDNVRFTRDGRVKVLDFGLACTVPQDGSGGTDATTVARDTTPGAVLGTPGYMAPEQARGQPADSRSDIFAFGCLVYEMLTSRATFARDTVADSLAATLQEDVEPPSRIAARIPAELDAIVMRCLEKRPDDRYQSARDLAFSLRTVIGERGPSSGRGSRPPGASRRRYRFVGAGLALVAIVVASVWLLWPKPPLQSLAVLPFINESGDENAAFLCDGIAESIINRLATISELRVVPSSTAFHFRGEEDLDRIAQALGVRAVLTGRLIRRGDELTIRVSLDDMQEDRRLWGHPFRGRLDKVLELETDIADRVADELRLRLTDDERSRLARGGTTVPDAHFAYMRGRYFWWQRNSTEDDWKAAAQFERAIELDPNYALPYCGLVDAQCILASWGALQPLGIRDEAQTYVDTALTLDDKLSEAHVSGGLVAMFLNWDWPRAESAFERAIAIDPDLATAYLEYGRMLAWTGRYEDAERQYRAGIEANPVSALFLTGLGMLYSGTGRLAEAEKVLLASNSIPIITKR
jgi:serine/threonine protein kinase